MKAVVQCVVGVAALSCVGATGLLVARILGRASNDGTLALPPAEVDPSAGVRRVVDVPGEAPAEIPSEQPFLGGSEEALAALRAGDLESAVALLEEDQREAPDDPLLRRNLAEALTRLAVRRRTDQPPCASCVELLARATELDPSRGDLAKLLERWRAEDEEHQDFWRDSSLHFDLSFDGGRTELLWGSHKILNILEAAYLDLGERFVSHPVESGRPRIQVVIYRRENFGRLTGLGDWAGGAFDGTVRIPVEDLAAEEVGLRRILRHEVVHAFVFEVGGPRVPGWLNEGLAQWLEGDPGPAVRASHQKFAGKELYALEKLEGNLSAWTDPAEIARAYAQSLLFCDHIAGRYGERVLCEMVAGCQSGTPPAESFRTFAGDDLEDALADLAASLAPGGF